MPTGTLTTQTGNSYTFDFDARTVTVNNDADNATEWAAAYQKALDDGTDNPKLVGPQVDFMRGLSDSWDGPTENAIAVMLEQPDGEIPDQWDTDTPRPGWGERPDGIITLDENGNEVQ